MEVARRTPDPTSFNPLVELPFGLRIGDFNLAMQDIYDFLFDVNTHLVDKGLQRLDEMLRPANLSGMLSDMLTASMARHSRSLVVNAHHNGHPDLLVRGQYYFGQVVVADFRRNERGDLGTRSSTLHAEGIAKLRSNWVYLDGEASTRKAAKRGKALVARSK